MLRRTRTNRYSVHASSVSNLHYLCCVVLCAGKNHGFQTIFSRAHIIKNYRKNHRISNKKYNLCDPYLDMLAKCMVCSAITTNVKMHHNVIRYFVKSILISAHLTFLFASDWHQFWQTNPFIRCIFIKFHSLVIV